MLVLPERAKALSLPRNRPKALLMVSDERSRVPHASPITLNPAPKPLLRGAKANLLSGNEPNPDSIAKYQSLKV
jgi:hypothetical protein